MYDYFEDIPDFSIFPQEKNIRYTFQSIPNVFIYIFFFQLGHIWVFFKNENKNRLKITNVHDYRYFDGLPIGMKELCVRPRVNVFVFSV